MTQATKEVLYAILVCGLTVYTLAGLKDAMRLRTFLRFILLFHILGDFMFSRVWDTLNTYSFLRNVTVDDKLLGGGILTGALLLTDLGYLVVSSMRRPSSVPVNVQEAPANEREPVFRSLYLVVGIVLKIAGLAAVGILSGKLNLASYKPEDSVGFAFLNVTADMLIPFGLAVRRWPSPVRAFPFLDMTVLTALSLVSSSKSLLLNYLVTYFVSSAVMYGLSYVRQIIFNKWFVVVVLSVIVGLGIKTQNRDNKDVNLSPTAVLESAVSGVSARFMGGIYRTYLVTAREVLINQRPTMGGEYHAQTFYLWVPRLLWADKPRVAAERLYDYLNVTEESYGTAFAVNAYGALLVDLGPTGLALGASLMGALFALGDSRIRSRSRGRLKISQAALATIWLISAVPLSEGGIPPAVTSIVIQGSAFVVIHLLNQICYHVIHTIAAKPQLHRWVLRNGGAGVE